MRRPLAFHPDGAELRAEPAVEHRAGRLLARLGDPAGHDPRPPAGDRVDEPDRALRQARGGLEQHRDAGVAPHQHVEVGDDADGALRVGVERRQSQQ
ncbi:hypothetical protein AB0F88_29540 [Streptosporangium sp. NPDC023963]|uniref:hypothetical protein n=1 Tax=Streptosporangium sp. NPDC023963 TaxID=3155608 RepID=UPI0034146A6B